MDDLHQDSHAQTGLESKHFALCSEHFKSSYFGRSVLIGTPVDFKRFYLEEGSVPSIYMKPKDSLDIDYSRNEGRLANRFFPEKRSLDVPNPSPPQKKLISFRTGQAYSRYAFDLPRWQIHDPVHEDRPILESRRVQRRHGKLKQTANNELQKSIFLGDRETSQE